MVSVNAYLRATTQFHSLVDNMTTNLMMLDIHSVWLDPSTSGLLSRSSLSKSVSSMTHTHVVLICSREDRTKWTSKLHHGDAHNNYLQAVCGNHRPWRKRESHLRKATWAGNGLTIIHHVLCVKEYLTEIPVESWAPHHEAAIYLRPVFEIRISQNGGEPQKFLSCDYEKFPKTCRGNLFSDSNKNFTVFAFSMDLERSPSQSGILIL